MAVNLNGNFVLAQFAQCAFGKANFGLVDFTACSGHHLGDIAGSDRTKQLAFFASCRFDVQNFQRIDGFGAAFCCSSKLSCSSFQLGATRLKLCAVVFGSRYSFALRYQVITTKTGLNIDLITQATQIAYIFQQNDVHLTFLCWGVTSRLSKKISYDSVSVFVVFTGDGL